MKLTVLVDNNTFIDRYYYGEPGLSFYIEDGDLKLLFDTGYSDIFLSNANKLGIDLSKINYLVLSHGHNDHTGGLKYLKDRDLSKVTLVAHKDVFVKREYEGLDISSPVSINDLKVKEYIEANKVINITDKLLFLGPIERSTDFEGKPLGVLTDTGEPDYLLDDSALVYKGKQGLFIITACSHSGICNIINYAKSVTGINKINGLIGGLHLMKDDERLDKTIDFLSKEKITNLYPCHCVALKPKIKLANATPIKSVGVGLTINL